MQTTKTKYNNHITIQKLQNNGYGVRISHYRHFDINGQIVSLPQYCINFLGDKLLAKGGRSEVAIFDPVNKKYYKGISDCSFKDVFNRKEGLKLALNRAIPYGFEKVMLG